MVANDFADLLPWVRTRMTGLNNAEVATVAQQIWNEGTVAGQRPGCNWTPFVSALPADMAPYYLTAKLKKS